MSPELPEFKPYLWRHEILSKLDRLRVELRLYEFPENARAIQMVEAVEADVRAYFRGHDQERSER